jgi:hypothetical protein
MMGVTDEMGRWEAMTECGAPGPDLPGTGTDCPELPAWRLQMVFGGHQDDDNHASLLLYDPEDFCDRHVGDALDVVADRAADERVVRRPIQILVTDLRDSDWSKAVHQRQIQKLADTPIGLMHDLTAAGLRKVCRGDDGQITGEMPDGRSVEVGDACMYLTGAGDQPITVPLWLVFYIQDEDSDVYRELTPQEVVAQVVREL